MAVASDRRVGDQPDHGAIQAKPGEPPDYAGRDLTYLDLSGLDFKQATLARTDLYGVDFTGSDLKGTDMSHARLDRAVLRHEVRDGLISPQAAREIYGFDANDG